jgi:acetolactate synthase-1/3 small subunit
MSPILPTGPRTSQTLIVYVQDEPGALNRIVSLFRRRAFNIDSLTVGRTERPGVSRITLVVQVEDETARRLETHLYKLVEVLRVEDVSEAAAVVREMAFVKVAAPAARRSELLQLCNAFRARVVDVGPSSIVVETTGAPEKLDGLIEVLRPFGILEMVRTGAVAMLRGQESVSLPDVSEVAS